MLEHYTVEMKIPHLIIRKKADERVAITVRLRHH